MFKKKNKFLIFKVNEDHFSSERIGTKFMFTYLIQKYIKQRMNVFTEVYLSLITSQVLNGWI